MEISEDLPIGVNPFKNHFSQSLQPWVPEPRGSGYTVTNGRTGVHPYRLELIMPQWQTMLSDFGDK